MASLEALLDAASRGVEPLWWSPLRRLSLQLFGAAQRLPILKRCSVGPGQGSFLLAGGGGWWLRFGALVAWKATGSEQNNVVEGKEDCDGGDTSED